MNGPTFTTTYNAAKYSKNYRSTLYTGSLSRRIPKTTNGVPYYKRCFPPTPICVKTVVKRTQITGLLKVQFLRRLVNKSAFFITVRNRNKRPKKTVHKKTLWRNSHAHQRRYLTILWKCQRHGGWSQKDNRVQWTHTCDLRVYWCFHFVDSNFFFSKPTTRFPIILVAALSKVYNLVFANTTESNARNTNPGSESALFARASTDAIRICSNWNMRTFRK